MSSRNIVTHEGFSLELSISPLKLLLPHEETLPDAVRRLKERLLKDGAQRDPIIVDSDSMVILDGMHRRQALLESSARRALVCKVDYSDSRVKVARWLRFAPGNTEIAERLAAHLGFPLHSTSEEAISLVDSHESCAALIFGDKAWLSERSGGPSESFPAVRAFDTFCASSRLPVSFHMDRSDLADALHTYVCLYVPVPKKSEVVHAALTGALFPPKSTRHMIPARPLGVGVSLSSLVDDSVSAEESASRELKRLLQTATPRRLGPGAFYKGRKYEETIYVYKA